MESSMDDMRDPEVASAMRMEEALNDLRAERAALVKALRDIIEANDDFRKGMPDGWEGDPLQDACEAARALVGERQ